MTRRFPARVYGVGQEPDPRFTLANERTFLAWIRTALALIAGGVAVDAVALPLPVGVRVATAAVLLGLGLVLPVVAWLNWAAAERALRLGRPLPSSFVSLPLAGGVVLVAVLIVVGLLIR
ncbi:YidH family protein [Amnibacterium endophyticum]|uniref:YidH family protein n=1 Tax=Amnibacterium endophyticum TaxID=2109337 RepID=A0ABW4LDF0_9MICO